MQMTACKAVSSKGICLITVTETILMRLRVGLLADSVLTWQLHQKFLSTLEGKGWYHTRKQQFHIFLLISMPPAFLGTCNSGTCLVRHALWTCISCSALLSWSALLTHAVNTMCMLATVMFQFHSIGMRSMFIFSAFV